MNNVIKLRVAALFMTATIAVAGVSGTYRTVAQAELETVRKAGGASNSTADVVTLELNSPNDILKYGTKEEKILNSAPLDPMQTNDEWLDTKVDEILAEITTVDMSNYEKVRAINNYMVQHYKYNSSSKATSVSYKSNFDRKIVQRAKGLVSTGHGTCTEWAALFMVFTRNIGLNMYSITGTYKGGSHTWNVLRIDDTDYIFDAELDFRVSNGGATRYRNFCTTSTTGYHASNKSGNINSFKNFSVY